MPIADNDILNVNPGGPTMFIYSQSPHAGQSRASDFANGARREKRQEFIEQHS